MLYKEEIDLKKIIAGAVALLLCATAFAGCTINNGTPHTEHDFKYKYIDDNSHKITCTGCNYEETEAHNRDYSFTDENNHKVTCSVCGGLDKTEAHVYESETDLTCEPCGHSRDWYKLISDDTKDIISADGYVKDKISDFSQYVGTSAYRTVSTADELIAAIKDAKYDYKNTWDGTTKTFSQTLNSEGKVHVIEITNDLNLGYNKLSAAAKSSGVVDNFTTKYNSLKDWLYWSDMFLENGISQIKVENTSNLLIYSKNGAKITHAGFKLTSDTNVVFRNLQFDEMWQWEDAPNKGSSKIGDYDAVGWAYFKVSFCGYVWIDHCTFGKSYDGQIDYSNPVYDTEGTAFRAPYGADGSNGLHISWCKFNAGSDDPDGYLYKMMEKIEQTYQAEKNNTDGSSSVLYYKALRDGGISFEDILYGIAIPQKKGFLCGDSGNGHSDYDMNLSLQVSFSNCYFRNFEDRIPKLRGGNAYMYNCVVDSLEYYGYRANLTRAGAANKVKAVNSGWKCALVSQGIVCGNGGSFYGENCIFRGIQDLLKNNDSGGSSNIYAEDNKTVIGTTSRPKDGGYQLVNCSYQQSATSTPSTTFVTNASKSILTPENFKWNTSSGEAPFEVKEYALDALEDLLNHPFYGAGVNTIMQERFLNSKYGA